MRHVTHMNKLCHTCEWVMSHIWTCRKVYVHCGQESRTRTNHVTRVKCRITHMKESWHTHERVTSHVWMQMTSHVWNCRMQRMGADVLYMHIYVQIYVKMYVQIYVLAFVGKRHGTHMNKSSHTYEWVTSHTSMSRVTHMNGSRGTRKRAMSHTWKSHITHVNVQKV